MHVNTEFNKAAWFCFEASPEASKYIPLSKATAKNLIDILRIREDTAKGLESIIKNLPKTVPYTIIKFNKEAMNKALLGDIDYRENWDEVYNTSNDTRRLDSEYFLRLKKGDKFTTILHYRL